MEQLGSQSKDFREILYFNTYQKAIEKIIVSFKSDKNKGTLQEDQNTFLIITRLILLGVRNFQTNFV
jgi:hypothetical protein